MMIQKQYNKLILLEIWVEMESGTQQYFSLLKKRKKPF